MNPQGKKLIRNTFISGILIFLLFVILKYTVDESQPRSLDNINSSRALLLMINGFILPGFLFALAVILATFQSLKEKWKAWVYVLVVSVLYVILVFSSISEYRYIIYASAVGGILTPLITHFLLFRLNRLIMVLGLGAALGAIAFLPVWLSQGSLPPDSQDSFQGITGFLIFPLWHVLIGGLIALSMDFWPGEEV